MADELISLFESLTARDDSTQARVDDLGLTTLRRPQWISTSRQRYEAKHGCTLPRTGALHDMGSTVSHNTATILI